MNQLSLLGLAQTAMAQTAISNPVEAWNGAHSLVMSAACLSVLFIASRTINYPNVGPKMPLGPFGALFNNISLAGFLGSMSLGHVVGAFLIIKFFSS